MTKFIEKKKISKSIIVITHSKLFFFVQLSLPRFTKLLPIVHKLFMVRLYRKSMS